MLVVLVSLAAALAYAIASVLQQHAASAQPADKNLRPGLVLALARRPVWLVGIAASALGLLLQLLALSRGSLTVVQPVLVCGLIFALPINAFLVQRRRLSLREWTAALAVTAGLALFLATAGRGGGRDEASGLSWVVVVAAVSVVAALLVAASRAMLGAGRAALQGAGAGIANGLSAAFSKAVAHHFAVNVHHGFGQAVLGMFTSWESYALAGSLAVVIVLVQSAFQSGPISWSLPSLTALNPIASVAIGVGLLHEHVRTGAGALLGELTGLAIALYGVFALARSGAFDRERLRPLALVRAQADPMARPAPAPAADG